ncbi:hypothetical protein OAC11_05580 [Alphaproteobacteria bacterium]|jgi:hypothetical protein|nr:hypothetical protein [Alphaproteobacteria bacterium]|tara:strand:- start:904 stop:1056 length:153 start_codon:yes stop_codon:yes gene_type:complete
MVKWVRFYHSKKYKPRTPKQIEREKLRVQKIMKEMMEDDFHEITCDKKCV